MSLLTFGISHKKAPIALREHLVATPQELPHILRSACHDIGLSEAAFISTCNRSELYCQSHNERSQQRLQGWFSEHFHLPANWPQNCFYHYQDAATAQHLMRVSCGLESQILGEAQIFGQIKAAYRQARQHGFLGPHLERLFQHTFAAAKKVRSDTAIGSGSVSVAHSAVQLALRIFGDLQRPVLLIGAGATAELVARHLQGHQVRQLIIANRQLPRAQKLAKNLRGTAVPLSAIADQLAVVDIVISSTASALPILGKGTVEHALRHRRHRPLLLIDLAVPRDIEPQIKQLDDVFLYTLDDLQQVLSQNQQQRQQSVVHAERIIEGQTERFMAWLQGQGATAAIVCYRRHGERQCAKTLALALQELRSGTAAEAVLQRLTHRLSRQMLHHPSVALRRLGEQGKEDSLQQLIQLLDLDSSAS